MPLSSYTPSTKAEARDRMMARVVGGAGPLDDVTEGGVAYTLLDAVGEEVEAIEFRQWRFVRAYSFEDAVGEELDERAAQLPPGKLRPQRLGPTVATAQALRITRANPAGALTLPAGALCRSSVTGRSYRIVGAVDLADGVAVHPTLVTISALEPGSVGSAATGTIDQIDGFQVQVINEKPLVGHDSEADVSFRQRCLLYLSSLGGLQAAALRLLALSFVSADGVRLQHAKVHETPFAPAYAELIVDDGTGMGAWARPGLPYEGTAPPGGQSLLWSDGPAKTEPRVYVGGALVAGGWLPVEEQGQVFLEAALAGGASWRTEVDEVYTGPIAELQAVVNGSTTDPLDDPGHRTCGGRVRVVAPVVQQVKEKLLLNLQTGADAETVKESLRAIAEAHYRALGPGEPRLLAPYIAALMGEPRVRNLRVLDGTTLLPAGDLYPFGPEAHRAELRLSDLTFGQILE